MLKTPNELIEYVIHSTEKRLNKNYIKLAISAILAGLFIGLGAVGNILVSADLYLTNQGLAKFIGACVFPVGLIAIVMLGFELFTSNTLMSIALVERKIKFNKMFEILSIVWIFNLIGGVLLAMITYKTHTLSQNGVNLLLNMAEHKVHTPILDLVLKGIMCNILVCGASLLGYISKDGISKIFGIWFPIMLFILLGYSHVVANMLYLPLAYLYGSEAVTIFGIIYNFIFVSIGNFIGGAIFIGLSYWYMNKK